MCTVNIVLKNEQMAVYYSLKIRKGYIDTSIISFNNIKMRVSLVLVNILI